MFFRYKIINVISILIFSALLFACLSTSFADVSIENTTVGGINTALSNVNDGENIFLAPGNYTGSNNTNIIINKNVTIIGNGSTDSVIIDAEGISGIFTIGSEGNNVNVTFINTTFINGNRASYGGAIQGTQYTTGMTFINCTFINNTVYGVAYGGVIYSNGTNNVMVVDSTFLNNTGANGGVIFNTNGENFTIINSVFTFNDGGNGAAIYNQRGSNFRVDNSTFINNSVGNGGTIYNDVGGNFTVTNSTFINSTGGNGAALYNNGGLNFRVDNSSFINSTGGNGAALYNNGGLNFRVDNSSFINNSGGNGGALFNNGGHNFEIINSSFINNTADEGGAIFNMAGTNFNFISSNFLNNKAIHGGGIYHFDGSILVNDSIFTNNTQAITLGSINYQLNNNTLNDNIIAIEFTLYNQNYTIPDLINPSSVVNVPNNIANNTYAIGIGGTGSNYTLSDSSYNTSGNANGVIFTGILSYYSVANGNILRNSTIQGYSGVGVTFDEGSRNNTIFKCNITNNDIGVLINGTGNSIIGSNILNNNLGIHILEGISNTTINFNRIFNNTAFNGFDLLNNGLNTNANYNWWGNNTPMVSGITLDNWFVMELVANNFTTIVNATTNQPNGNVELSYELLLINGATEETNFVDYSQLPDFLVNLIWNGSSGIIYNLTNVNAKGKYSRNVTLTLDNWFSIQAIGDTSDLILFLERDLSDIVNLTINKTINTTTVNYGDYVTYTITVTNNGLANATGVVVTDILDHRLIFVSTTGDYDNNTGLWIIGNLNAGDNISLNITVRVMGTGNIANIANVSLYETNMGENGTDDDDANFTVNQTVNLTIFKDNNVTGSVAVGDEVLYTIVVTNFGPDVATGVVVVDVLDPRLIYIGSSAGGVYDPVTRTVSWNISSIAVGDNVTLTVSVRVNGSGNIPNVANVTVNETNIGENTAINYINLPSQDSPDTVNLTITKENNVTGSVAVGDEVLYTIVVTNFGPDVATGVVVVDVLDPRLIYIGSSAGGVYDPATRTVSWNIETIAIGDNVTLTVTVKVNGSGNINNFANLTVNETNIGDNGTDGEDSNFTVNQTVNLTITKTHNATGLNVGVGNLLTFTIVVTNHGPGIATGVVVTDNLDSRLMFVSTTGNYNPNTSLWTIGVLNVGDSISLDITVRVSGTGNIGNIANVTVNEINLGDNSTGSDDTNFTANETDTGDDNIGDVDPTGNLTISKIIIGNVSTKPFINTTISISLLDEFGNPIINENIIVMIDGQEYNIITNNNGIAFLHYTPSIANNLPITAYFNGTDTYLNSTSTGVLLVHKIPTSITASIDQNQNISTTFIAALIDEFNQPLIGEHIRFILDGQFIGTAVTDSYGIAVLNHSFIAGGSIIVEFLGGNVYQESSDYRLFNSNDSSSPNLENSTEDNLVDPFNPTDPDDSINPFDPTDSDNPEDLNDSNTSTDDLDSNGSNSSITMSKTANPIALLVLSLLSIFFIVLKRR